MIFRKELWILLVTAILVGLLHNISWADSNKGNSGKKKGHHKQQTHVNQLPVQKVIVQRQALTVDQAKSQDNGAPVMAHSCPFSCATLGIEKSHCRDWREGRTCFVQDLNARSIGYRIVSPPSNERRYYTIELPSIVSPGQAIGDKIDRTINQVIR